MNMADTNYSKDLLGQTYEFCIAQFAAYESVKGGEFYTPSSIVKAIVAILNPFENRRTAVFTKLRLAIYTNKCSIGTKVSGFQRNHLLFISRELKCLQ